MDNRIISNKVRPLQSKKNPEVRSATKCFQRFALSFYLLAGMLNLLERPKQYNLRHLVNWLKVKAEAQGLSTKMALQHSLKVSMSPGGKDKFVSVNIVGTVVTVAGAGTA